MHRPTILLADDHLVFTDAIVRILQEQFDVIGVITDGHLLLEAARRLRPDVIVSDISMPTLSGLEALRQLKAGHDASRVIFLTMHGDARLAAEALRLGARGFVLKQSSGDDLIRALHAVLQGHTYISPALTDDVMSVMSNASGLSGGELTTRQKEVLRMIVNGCRMKEIASNLNLSPRTVETIKYDMMRGLNLHSTPELVRYAMTHQLVAF